MTVYLGIVHKDPDSEYGISFPDVPGCFSAGASMEELMDMAAEALALHLDGETVPRARSFEELRGDADFERMFEDAVILLPVEHRALAVAAE